MQKWGLPKDEFTDNGNWSHQIYVREARRMIGAYVMTENELLKKKPTPESVGMGSYTIDSHNVQRYITPEGYVQNEGDIGVGLKGPYEIAFGSLMPKKEQCQNLTVPICVSSTHIAFGSIRMEPVFMILGQSAATAAVMAIDAKQPVQDVPYAKLREQLLKDGQILEYEGSRTRETAEVGKAGIDAKTLSGVVIDDSDAKLTGDWHESSANGRWIGRSYIHDGAAKDGKCSAKFEAKLPQAGRYEVRLAYSSNTNRASNVPVEIHTAGGAKTVTVNQQLAPKIDGLFVSLGEFDFGASAVVSITNRDTNGHVIIDGVQWLEAR